MRGRMYLVLGIVGLVVIGMVWFRVAPSDITRWHVPVSATENEDHIFGATRVLDGPRDILTAFDTAMMGESRTQRLAGTADDAHVTFVTRSAFWGFPDYTTAQWVDGQLRVFGRLRYGMSDLGVNRNRLERVLNRIK